MVASNTQRIALARRLAWQRELARYQQSARNAAARITAANDAHREGNTRIAGRLLRVVSSQRNAPAQFRAIAREALNALRQEALDRMDAVETELGQSTSETIPSSQDRIAQALEVIDGATFASVPALAAIEPHNLPRDQEQKIRETFAKMEQLLWDYETVPGTRRTIKTRLNQLRRLPQYAAAMNEPKARRLVALARNHERQDQSCCAYLVYTEAAKLRHAPSAQFAQAQLASMTKDGAIADAVARCRKLRKCHETYQVAQLLAKTGNIAVARKSYEQIVADAPPNSEIRSAAQKQLAALNRTDG